MAITEIKREGINTIYNTGLVDEYGNSIEITINDGLINGNTSQIDIKNWIKSVSAKMGKAAPNVVAATIPAAYNVSIIG